MPTLRELFYREFREFFRYSGDGKPNPPTGAPLPIGDPQSGPYAPSKAQLRNGLGDVGDAIEAARDLAQEWAEGTTPGGPGTMSAREFSELSQAWAEGTGPEGPGTKSSREWSLVSQDWAEGEAPGGPGTRSSEEWSEESHAQFLLSQNAASLSQSYAADAATVSGVYVPIHESRATAGTATIAVGVKRIWINYYAPNYPDPATLVGGAHYRRISLADLTDYPAASYFRSQDIGMPDGTTDSTNGGYWVLDASEPTLEQMGGVGDFDGTPGTGTDNTAAFAALIDYCKLRSVPANIPDGNFRVTSGYTDATAENVFIRGRGRNKSIMTMDNDDDESFFYYVSSTSTFDARKIGFACAQEVTDRKFWRRGGAANNGAPFFFTDVFFDGVEKPICFESGCYFQMARLSNVTFWNSGTIHSEVVGVEANTSTLVGTLLVLDNVNHDGTVPANTEKVVCNLQSIRQIKATNLLMEGSLPSAGWTVVMLTCRYNTWWTRGGISVVDGFWSEWTLNAPAYTIDQQGGRVWLKNFAWGAGHIKLSAQATVHIDGWTSSDTSSAETKFEFEDYRCHAILENCVLRRANLQVDNFTLINCSYTETANRNSTVFSNDGACCLYRWDGGFFDQNYVTITHSGGTLSTPSYDATYGRKYVLLPNGDFFDARFSIQARGLEQYDQVTAVATVRLPAFTGGTIAFENYEQFSTQVDGSSAWDSASSGQVVKLFVPRLITNSGVTQIDFRFRTLSATGVSGNFEILALALYKGNSAPREEHPAYPRNIVTWNTAAPANGQWLRGDVVWNRTPSASGAPGWVCVADGTPGTWKAMANLAS